jgi:hypothetical protein
VLVFKQGAPEVDLRKKGSIKEKKMVRVYNTTLFYTPVPLNLFYVDN